MGEQAEKALKFIDDYLSPWGAWKTAWWEGEVGDDAAFSDNNALKHVANILRRPPSPTDQEAAALVEPRIIVRAAKCGHHFDEGCNACASAEKWANAQLDELRAQLAESQSEREEQARLLGMSGSREAKLR